MEGPVAMATTDIHERQHEGNSHNPMPPMAPESDASSSSVTLPQLRSLMTNSVGCSLLPSGGTGCSLSVCDRR